jgi:hypothetical protein
MGAAEAQVLEKIREWLANGATISAKDTSVPTFAIQPDGSCDCGVIVDYGG